MSGFLKRLIEAPDIARLRRRAEQDPTPRGSLELCRRLQMQGRSSDALEVARSALARFPHSRELHDVQRSTWKFSCRNRFEAYLQRARSKPSVETYSELIEHVMAYGEDQEAAQWSDQMVAEFPNDRKAALIHGKVYDLRFRTDHVALDGAKAIKSFRRAVEISPGAFEPHLCLAQICAYIGAVSKALHHAFKALDVDSEHQEAGALQKRLSQIPLEKESETELLRAVEENDGPPKWGYREGGHVADAVAEDVDGELQKGMDQLSSMAGVRRVAISHEGLELQAATGTHAEAGDGGKSSFGKLAFEFRRIAALSSKRMGIGGFQEAGITWTGGQILAFAAGPTILVIEADTSPRVRAVIAEARNLLATCTQTDVAPLGGDQK